ncbi:MAG TPA: cellulase family glycosylhydrolase [Anaerolineales bacterium]
MRTALYDGRVSRRRFLKMLGAGAALPSLAGLIGPLDPVGGTEPPNVLYAAAPQHVAWTHLPRWRGFNLLEKFRANVPERDRPYEEWDFDVIAEWGFDFVRLPLDYRIWTISPGVYKEEPLREIDQAVSWAQARGIHVNVAFHWAPGYRVGLPRGREPFDLWGDDPASDEARRQFAAQWRMFAQRYRGIPPEQLSFNLVNEPPNISGAKYFMVAAAAVEAIRTEDPARLIIADGSATAGRPVPELNRLRVGQSTRGYAPFSLTHYRASWAAGSNQWPVPTWPMVLINPYLYGEMKTALQSPLILRVSIPEAVSLIIRVNVVTTQATLRVRTDGATAFEKSFMPGPGQGEWKESKYSSQWGSYQAVYDREYEARVPAGIREIAIEITSGDWMTISEVRLGPFSRPPQEIILRPNDQTWGVKQGEVIVNPDGTLSGGRIYDRARLWADLEPWRKFAESGVGVHVGEWGAYNQTPHDVTLAWMTDYLDNLKRVGFGWALWQLRGDFGVMDSGRSDVAYESFRGHKLDRKMLEILLRA